MLVGYSPRTAVCCVPHREGEQDQHGSWTQLMRGMGLWEGLGLKIRGPISETSSRRQPQKVCNDCKVCRSSCSRFGMMADLFS